MPIFLIQNSIAFVTGANKPNGIGRAIVEALLENGASKVYATARQSEQLDDLVSQKRGKVVAVELDVEDLQAIEKLQELYPDVTLVVNNAGYLSGSSTIGEIDKIKTEMLVNFFAPLAIGKAFSTVFASFSKAESDIQPASFVNFPAAGTYVASKAAAHSLTQAQRRDFSNSLVIGVYPGPVDTAMTDGYDMVKAAPSAVAQSVVDALSSGVEDFLIQHQLRSMTVGRKTPRHWNKNRPSMDFNAP
jgi:NAD(P)-dependent dehydrogenase (short-subunit alcohol dehydrogenase family)